MNTIKGIFKIILFSCFISCGNELMYINKNDYPIEIKVYYKNDNYEKIKLNKYKSYLFKVKFQNPQRHGTLWNKKQIEEYIKSIARIDIISEIDSISISENAKILNFLKKGEF